jgi:hypothetical protein
VQNFLWSNAHRLQFVRGKVTTAMPQIIPRVAKNVDELQTLSVLNPKLAHFRFRPLAEIGDMRKTDPRPKFPHTSRHEISVFIELS